MEHPSYGAIDTLAPVLIFGFLFGVSMDYEVFILALVREGDERTGSTSDGRPGEAGLTLR